MRDITGKLGEEAKVVRVLYGGSVKPGNAQEILALPGVAGALVAAPASMISTSRQSWRAQR
jgi:triosephosphate isomerase (TIM)